MKRIFMISLWWFVITFSIVSAVTYAKNDAVCEKYVRAHIIANSDDVKDQAIKYAIRDYVFDIYEDEFLKFETKKGTLDFINLNKEEIVRKVNDYLFKNGIKYRCKVTVKKEKFSEKKYGNIFLPDGNYDAFKIILGEGKGKNFFCVMFPPMCIDEGVTVSHNPSGKIVYKSKILQMIKGD